ncbi:MAG: hypothetical protein ACI8QD_002932 [Cyclobacteriaceae bacterium]
MARLVKSKENVFRQMKKLIYALTVIVSSAILFSCGSGEKSEQSTDKTVEALEAFVEEEFEYPIPTSYEVTNMLQKAKANFVFDITNSPENLVNYETEWQKAMNLGVYGADLSYASTYNRQEEIAQFLDVSRKLIEDLNISTAFNKGMVDRLERNVENKDSLILIVTESFYETYNYLNINGEEKTSLLVIAGSVIEGLHITSQLIISSDYNDELMKVLANQKSQVKKLVELMDAHADDENVNRVLPKLRYIDLFFDQLGESSDVSKAQFNDVYESIQEMRSTVVG